MDYRCRTCGVVFKRFTGTVWATSGDRCATIVQILRGSAHGVPTKHVAAALGIDRGHVLEMRHRIHGLVAEHRSPLGATPRCGHRGR